MTHILLNALSEETIPPPIQQEYCLLFGALISPTDPIAVMGILKTAGAPKSVELVIAGESLFNDGVGVVIFALLLGVLADKESELMCRELVPLASRVAAVRVSSNRSLAPAALAGLCQQANPAAQVTAHDSVAAALAALAPEPRVVIAGSLYLIGEALERLGLGPAAGERGLNEWQPTSASR